MPRYAVFIRNPEGGEGEFVGLTRVNFDGADEDAASTGATGLLTSMSRGTFTSDDVALCAQLSVEPESQSESEVASRPPEVRRMF